MATPRQTDHLAAHEESRHEDHPPHVSLTSTHARRHADPQLLAPHDRWLSALRRPICQALWHLAGSPGTRAHPYLSTPSAPYPRLREHLHPERVWPPASLRRPICQALWHLAGSPGTRAHPYLSTPSAPYPRLREHLHPDRVCPPLS